MLETELRGAAKTVVDALLYTPEMYNVTSLKEAFESKDYDTVVSIIISSRNDSLMDMKEKYFAGEYNCFFFFFFLIESEVVDYVRFRSFLYDLTSCSSST